ncbi:MULTISPECIES: hypothetical protein [unclassified Isoptericola]|uniref:hypothetical protein n=1 Tax=unclassified Isoptericola TaxID=2623355 RepID=UPI0027132735|nr:MULTISPECIES: hypothetical protein [unclassified Isoptericola]MDO8143732.1 hypothetical protein [Isoptericola sp. 178]MDO8150067.1 hypothetical protein [Isoptericola sp. b408]
MVALGSLVMMLGGIFAWLGGLVALVGLVVTLNGVFYAVQALDSIAAVTYNQHLRDTSRS